MMNKRINSKGTLFYPRERDIERLCLRNGNHLVGFRVELVFFSAKEGPSNKSPDESCVVPLHTARSGWHTAVADFPI